MVLRISTRARSKNCLYCLELHRTFFLRIGNGLTSFWLDESVPIKMHARMRDWPAMVQTRPIKKIPTSHTDKRASFEMISCVEFTRLHIYYIYEVIYIFRLQLPVKFVVLLRAACLSPEEGKRKLVHSRFFLPLEPWTNSKTVQCVQYLIWMYLPCLAVNQIHHELSNSDCCVLWTLHPASVEFRTRTWRRTTCVSSKTNLTQTHAISLKHTETDFQKVTHNMLLKLWFQCSKITHMWI